MKQYQFKLSADFERIIVRELPDFKERYLRDPKLDGPTGEKYTLRFSREIVVSNAAELKYRKPLLRVITGRLHAAKRKLGHTKAVKQRKQITYDIQRLQKMQTQLGQAPAAPDGSDHPKVRAAIHRAIKTRRQAIKRKFDRKGQRLTEKERIAFLDGLKVLADIESQRFGVVHKAPKSFSEYCGRFPTADDIIHNAVIQRCLKSEKPHLILPKLTAMFPENYARDSLTIPDKLSGIVCVKYWEIVADNLTKADWSWGCVSGVDSRGRTIWIAEAHRDITRRLVVRARESAVIWCCRAANACREKKLETTACVG